MIIGANVKIHNCSINKTYPFSKPARYPFNVCIPPEGGIVQTPVIVVTKNGDEDPRAECRKIRCPFNTGIERS